jgi:glutathione S-transferase
MTARYTLYGLARSGPTYKVGLMLALINEPYHYVHINLREGEHKKPDYLAKSRFGQVPCLEDHQSQQYLAQSASILEYLADKSGKFSGATLQERIAIREWLFWDFDKLAPFIYRPRAAKAGFRQFDPAVLAQYEGEGHAALTTLDAHLKDRHWLVAEAPSIADIDIYGVIAYASEGGYDLAGFPHLTQWLSRFEQLPQFRDRNSLLPQESQKAA